MVLKAAILNVKTSTCILKSIQCAETFVSNLYYIITDLLFFFFHVSNKVLLIQQERLTEGGQDILQCRVLWEVVCSGFVYGVVVLEFGHSGHPPSLKHIHLDQKKKGASL